MQYAVLDTSVLYAAAYRRDERHDDGIAILQGIDSTELPEGLVPDYVLAETLNGLTINAGHSAAVDFLERVEGNERFHVRTLTTDAFATAKGAFKRYERLSFVDACIVALARAEGVEYLYSFDDDFDGLEDLTRLGSALDPFAPE